VLGAQHRDACIDQFLPRVAHTVERDLGGLHLGLRGIDILAFVASSWPHELAPRLDRGLANLITRGVEVEASLSE
jgi:hypothetical protein